jgi:hypothetical protein
MSLVIRASDIKSRSIRWAWEGRLACGYLTVQTGIEGLGKSVFAAWLIARMTRGELDGCFHGEPVNVLVIAGEDGIEDTWRPRLELAYADLDRVVFLNLDELVVDWNIRDGIEQIRGAVDAAGASVVFIDAALDHMPPASGGESLSQPAFVRTALTPLKRLVRELDLVALYSMHPPKTKSADFRDMVQLSQAFSAIPRVGLLFAYHPHDQPDDPDRRRVLLRGKGNLGRDPGALEFKVVERPYEHDDGHVQNREFVADVRSSNVTMADLAPDRVAGARPPTKIEQAAEYIADALRGGEWRPARHIIETLRHQGLGSGSVVDAACQRAGVEKHKRTGELDGIWIWRIPTGEQHLEHTLEHPAEQGNHHAAAEHA